MSIQLESPEVEIRERRNHSILSYCGTAQELDFASQKCSLRCGDESFMQCSDCSMQRAFLQVGLIKDAAVVNHAPIGCAADFSLFNAIKRNSLVRRGQDTLELYAVSTNLQEKDIIYGAGEKLTAAIHEAFTRFQPKVIFITCSCASGIIGEDIDSIAGAAEEELGIPVIPIYCEGFKSKIWTTGSDTVYHQIVRKLVKPPKEKKNDTISIFNFEDVDAYNPLLAKIGMKAKYYLPLSTVEEIGELSEYAATGHICETLATYVAKALEEVYGVPEMKSPPPYGLDWTDAWLREIGRITHREEQVEKVIAEERKRIEPELTELRQKLAGKRVFITTGSSVSQSLASIVTDLGLKIVGQASLHHHQKFDTEDERVNSLHNMIKKCGDIKPYLVCNKQPYKIVHLLRQIQPDLLMLRHETISAIGTKLGIPTYFTNDVNICIGYDGILYVGKKILQVLARKNFYRNISENCRLPYTDWWYQQDISYFSEKNSPRKSGCHIKEEKAS